MLELRFVDCGIDGLQLQQRTRSPVVDASGAFCGFGEWGEWSAVPIVSGCYQSYPANLIKKGATIEEHLQTIVRQEKT